MITVACFFCQRPVKVSLWKWLTTPRIFCPPDEVHLCIGALRASLDDPPDEFEPEEDPRPDDFWVCPTCKGHQEVFTTRDWETGAWNTEECRTCRGTGWVWGLIPVVR